MPQKDSSNETSTLSGSMASFGVHLLANLVVVAAFVAAVYGVRWALPLVVSGDSLIVRVERFVTTAVLFVAVAQFTILMAVDLFSFYLKQVRDLTNTIRGNRSSTEERRSGDDAV